MTATQRRIAALATIAGLFLTGLIIWRLASGRENIPPHERKPARSATAAERSSGGEEFDEHAGPESDSLLSSPVYTQYAELPVSETELNNAHDTIVRFVQLFTTINPQQDLAKTVDQLRALITDESESELIDQFAQQIRQAESGAGQLVRITGTWWQTINPGQVTLIVSGSTVVYDQAGNPTNGGEARYAVTAHTSGTDWLITAVDGAS